MAGKLVRCVCGTVFEPAVTARCPACGTRYEAVEPVLASAPPASPDAATAQDHGPGTGTIRRYRSALAIGGGLVVLMGLALVVRSIAGGADDHQADGVPAQSASADFTTDRAAVPESGKDQAPGGYGGFEGTWFLLVSRMQPEQVIPGLPSVPMTLSNVVSAAFHGPDAKATLTVDQRGSYVIEFDITGDGRYAATITPERYPGTVAAQGVITFTPTASAMPDRVRALLMPVRSDMPHLGSSAGDTHLSLSPAGNAAASAIWVRPGGSGRPDTSPVGTWSNQQVYIDAYLPYDATLELTDAGDYRIRFTRAERGLLEAADGHYEFKRSVAMGPPVQGRYEFAGPDSVTFTEPRGSATWVRMKTAKR